jgi:F420-non-reducing hydrogenase small subunit
VAYGRKRITKVPEGEIKLPPLHQSVKHLAEITDVDYFMPGCPPVVDQVWKVFQAALNWRTAPKGAVIGADLRKVCVMFVHVRKAPGFRITEFKRPHEVQLDPDNASSPRA